jgi:hypothetical protein
MTKNIKTHNILDIIEISKNMEPSKCISKKQLWKCSFQMFPTIFQSSMGLGKSRCDVPNDTTQGQRDP